MDSSFGKLRTFFNPFDDRLWGYPEGTVNGTQAHPVLVRTEHLLARQYNDMLELDEVWPFWGDKRSGQVWLWVALCRRTRQVVGFALGDRSDQTCRQLYQNIASGKQSGKTAHIERWNNTLRQSLSRYVRKTLSFSKSLVMHFRVLCLFIWEYNRNIKHSSC